MKQHFRFSFCFGRIHYSKGIYVIWFLLGYSTRSILIAFKTSAMILGVFRVRWTGDFCRELEKVMDVMARNCCHLQIKEATSGSHL